MASTPLDNLVRIRQLKPQPPDRHESERLVSMARLRLADARQTVVSLEGRFSSAYTAAHAAALAALRQRGYRSENRYVVFQCLEHTLGWPGARWRILAAAHDARNRAEYEGFVDVEEAALQELIETAEALVEDVARLLDGD